MRISDWSSDVCSSDLRVSGRLQKFLQRLKQPWIVVHDCHQTLVFLHDQSPLDFREWLTGISNLSAMRTRSASDAAAIFCMTFLQIGRAPCREGVCQYV